MFSKRLCSWLNLVTPTFVRLGSTKFAWNPQRQLFLEVIENKRAVKFNGIFMGLYISFLLLQTMRYYFQKDINSVLVLITQQGAVSLAILSYLLTIIRGDLFYNMTNSFSQFFTHIQSKWCIHKTNNCSFRRCFNYNLFIF